MVTRMKKYTSIQNSRAWILFICLLFVFQANGFTAQTKPLSAKEKALADKLKKDKMGDNSSPYASLNYLTALNFMPLEETPKDTSSAPSGASNSKLKKLSDLVAEGVTGASSSTATKGASRKPGANENTDAQKKPSVDPQKAGVLSSGTDQKPQSPEGKDASSSEKEAKGENSQKSGGANKPSASEKNAAAALASKQALEEAAKKKKAAESQVSSGPNKAQTETSKKLTATKPPTASPAASNEEEAVRIEAKKQRDARQIMIVEDKPAETPEEKTAPTTSSAPKRAVTAMDPESELTVLRQMALPPSPNFTKYIQENSISPKSITHLFTLADNRWKYYTRKKSFAVYEKKFSEKGLPLKGLKFSEFLTTVAEKIYSLEKGPEKDQWQKMTAELIGTGFLSHFQKDKNLKLRPETNSYLMALFGNAAGLEINFVLTSEASSTAAPAALKIANWLRWSGGTCAVLDLSRKENPWDFKDQTIHVLQNSEVIALPLSQALEQADSLRGLDWLQCVSMKKNAGVKSTQEEKKISAKDKEAVIDDPIMQKSLELKKMLDDLKKMIG